MNQWRFKGAARVSSAGVKSPVARVRPQLNFGGALGCKVERDTLAESCPDLCGVASHEHDHATEQACLEKIDSAISLSADNNDNDVHSPNGCEAGTAEEKTCDDDSHHSQHSPAHKSVCCSLCRKKQKSGQADSNYQSYTDVSSIASYSSTRRPSSVTDAKPITNPELCRQLRMTNSSSTRLRPHRSATFTGRHSAPVVRSADQKILELMLAKREEQMMENQRREAAHRKWESERERSASAGSALRRDRRFTISNDRKKDQNSTPTSRQRPTSIDHRQSRNDVSKCSTPRSRHLSGGATSRGSSCEENGTDSSWCHTPIFNKCMVQRQLSEEKKQREAERKKRQEERLQQQKKNQDEYLRLLREEQQKELKRAESAKDVRAQEQQLKTKFRNFVTKKRQEEAINKKLKQESEENEQKKLAMAERLEQAEKKRNAIRQQRERHLHNFDLHDRLEKTKQKKEQLEMEMEVYRTELQTYLQMQEKRAEELAHEAVLRKKMKAQEGSIEKETLQRRNLERLIEQEEEWKAEVEADIAMKESRMKILQMEKDERIAQSRDLANTSRLLREQLRSHYSMNDLDQLNNRAQLESRIHSPTYHMSNLTIKDK